MTMQLMGPHMTTTQYSRKKKDQKILKATWFLSLKIINMKQLKLQECADNKG